MKKIIAACIYQVIEFDSIMEANHYAAEIEEKKQRLNVLKYEELPDGKVRVRVQKQYNNAPFPRMRVKE